MKRILFILLLGAISISSYSQLSLTPMVGYLLGGQANTIDGDLKFQNDVIWGGALTYMIKPSNGIEFLYLRADSEMFLKRQNGDREDLFNTSADYFLIGSTTKKAIHERFIPFINIGIGATRFNAKSPGVGDQWMFTATLAGGFEIMFFDRMSFRAEARMLAPMQFGGSGFWCGTGGCDVGVSGYTSFVQGSFTGGLIINLLTADN